MSKEVVVKFEIGDNLKRLLSHMTIAMQKNSSAAPEYSKAMVALLNNLEFANTAEFTKELKEVLRSIDV
jgi:hypothetical protein